jgi:hypothetical protein
MEHPRALVDATGSVNAADFVMHPIICAEGIADRGGQGITALSELKNHPM